MERLFRPRSANESLVSFPIRLSPLSTPVSSLRMTSPISNEPRFISPPSSAAFQGATVTVTPIRQLGKRLFATTPMEAQGSLPKKRGPIPFHQRFPNLKQTIMDVILDYGFAAHSQRSESWGTVGLSARAIRDETMKRLPAEEVNELQKPISVSVIARLMTPPNKSHLVSKRYLEIIPAKVGRKNNDISLNGKDSHYCKAAVNYALEAGACFQDEVQCWSADDKNKLLLGHGTPCVSRYISPRRYCMKEDAPRYRDHDWCTGYKLIPSGYLRLTQKDTHPRREHRRARSSSPPRERHALEDEPQVIRESPFPLSKSHDRCRRNTSKFTEDSEGRVHWRYPRTGPLTICLRGNKTFSATSYNHLDDMIPLVKDVVDNEGKTAVIVVSDNGPDWRKSSVKVFMCMGRLWRDQDLDYLCLTSYNSGDSRFNMIERSWGPITMWLAGKMLPATLPGEHRTPEQQTSLTSEEWGRKESQIFASAMESVSSCLAGKTYDGFPITINAIPADSEHIYDDEDFVGNHLPKASRRKLATCDQLAEFQFFNKHAIQRTFQLEFIKCADSSCDHCSHRVGVHSHLRDFPLPTKDITRHLVKLQMRQCSHNQWQTLTRAYQLY